MKIDRGLYYAKRLLSHKTRHQGLLSYILVQLQPTLGTRRTGEEAGKKRLQRANVACIIHEKMRSTISCRIEIALVQVYSSFRTSKIVIKHVKQYKIKGLRTW